MKNADTSLECYNADTFDEDEFDEEFYGSNNKLISEQILQRFKKQIQQ
jgi:hypothetical protein